MLGVVAVLLLFVALSLIPLDETIPPMRAGPETAFWTLRDGTRIAHIDLAPAGGRPGRAVPVIYLHGGPGGYVHSSIVARMRELAEEGYTVHLYDQIGSGRSDRLRRPRDYSFQRHVDDLTEIVDRHVGAPRVVLVAQSFGAMVAAHFVAAHPDRVAGVVFCSPGGLEPAPTAADGTFIDIETLYPAPAALPFRAPAEVWAETDRQLLRPRVLTAMTGAMLFNIKWASDREMDGLINTMASRFTRGLVCDPAHVLPEEGGGGGYAYMFSNWYDGVPDPRAHLREVVVPALVLQGQCDQAPYAVAYEYADLLRGRYVFVPDAGHEIWWDQPAAYVEHLRAFLEAVTS
ncbi:MAG: alpha/beta hydrolase [Opitutaceae bacterium]|nr:alpha/beta hydrolase [Opitutaceae bacterium]